jgi:hypothetical protein
MQSDDLILNELRQLRDELREYAQITTRNENDIRWLKGSAKLGVTLIAAGVSALVTFILKMFIK